jgi:hypothetical protein
MVEPKFKSMNEIVVPKQSVSDLPENWQRVSLLSTAELPGLAIVSPHGCDFTKSNSTFPAQLDWFQHWFSVGAIEVDKMYLVVRIANTERELNAGSVLLSHLLQGGFKIVEMNTAVLDRGTFHDILASFGGVRHEKLITRHRCLKFGKSLLWIEVGAAEEDYQEFAEPMIQVLNNVYCLDSKIPLAEDLKRMVLALPKPIFFEIPVSWTAYRTETGQDLACITIENEVEGLIACRIRLTASPDSLASPEGFKLRYQNYLEDLGVVVPKLHFEFYDGLDAELGGRWIADTVTTNDRNGNRVEVAAGFLNFHGNLLWYDIMETPSEATLYWHLVNERCLGIVLSSLRVS